MISTFDGGAFVHNGTDLCVRCCDAQLVCASYRQNEWNFVGLNKDGDIFWRFEGQSHPRHPHVVGGHIYLSGYAAAIKKYSLEGNLMQTFPYDASIDCCVDSSGNVYSAGFRYGNKTIRKYNSSGVLQWSVDTVQECYSIALNFDETMVVAAGDLYTVGGPPYYNLWVFATSNGAEVMKVGIGYNNKFVLHVGWDAWDNIFVLLDQNTGSTPVGKLVKIDIDGDQLWWVGTSYQRSMAIDEFYIYMNTRNGYVKCYTKCEDPATPGSPLLVWSVGDGTEENDHGSDGICLTEDGRLFTIARNGTVRELDPSNGDILATYENVFDHTIPDDGWRYEDIGSVITNFVATWALSNQYYAGVVAIWDGEIYRSLVKHISGGDAQWVWGGTYAIGDRCYWMDPNDTAYILENNAKGAADTTPPSSDVDWVEDDDEPGVGNNWEDYWEIKT